MHWEKEADNIRIMPPDDPMYFKTNPITNERAHPSIPFFFIDYATTTKISKKKQSVKGKND